jgi:hypothetical protein
MQLDLVHLGQPVYVAYLGPELAHLVQPDLERHADLEQLAHLVQPDLAHHVRLVEQPELSHPGHLDLLLEKDQVYYVAYKILQLKIDYTWILESI